MKEVNENLKQCYEEAVKEIEEKNDFIAGMEEKAQILNSKLDHTKEEVNINAINKVKAIEEEKRLLQVKHEKNCAELKNLKSEINDLNRSNNAAAIAMKSANKDTKDLIYKHDKKVEVLEGKIQELTDFKSNKLSEEKNLRSKEKKVNKKLKQLEEKEAKVRLKILETTKMQNKLIAEKNHDVNENFEKRVEAVVSPTIKSGNSQADNTISATTRLSNSLTDITTYPSLVTHWMAPQETSVLAPLPMTADESREILEKKLEQLNATNAKLLEDVPEEEIIFTAGEITALCLDWTTHAMIGDYMKNYA